MTDPPLEGTTVSWLQYWLAVRAGDIALQDERDRRYSEVKAAEEKALRVKEKADEIALGLQRDNQVYKDEKANELREQIASERGLYVTREELASAVREMQALIKPTIDYISSDAGRNRGAAETKTEHRLDVGQLVSYAVLLVAVITFLLLYITSKK